MKFKHIDFQISIFSHLTFKFSASFGVYHKDCLVSQFAER